MADPVPLFDPAGPAKDRKASRRTPTRDAALYDFLMRWRASQDQPLSLTRARARVDQLRGTTDIVGLRDAAINEALSVMAIAAELPPPVLLDEDDIAS